VAVIFCYFTVVQISHLLFPNWWQHFLGLVVTCKAMDATLYQDQTKLAIFVLTKHIKHISECTITRNKYSKSGDTGLRLGCGSLSEESWYGVCRSCL